MYDEYVDNNTPIITVEVMVDSSAGDNSAKYNVETQTFESIEVDTTDTGVHFLMDNNSEDMLSKFEPVDKEQETPKTRSELLEYMIRNDGSVICKLCGEVLQSRTHWYRHKYKQHVMQQMNPSPLFQCEQCLVYFKSRKGYIGHIASRHSELLADSSPVLTNMQAEALSKERQLVPLAVPDAVKEESDPESSIPISSVLNYQTSVVKHTPAKSSEPKKNCRTKEILNKAEWEERRSREEKLVADIIERVRRECETQQHPPISARKNYSRRTTAMHT